jgi:uncharacterized protein with FMN-binding domain
MVLSGAAIVAVYVAGYARTQAAADQWQVAGQPGAAAAADTIGRTAATPSASTAPSAAATPSAPAVATAPPPTVTYGDDGRRDGGRDGERERGGSRNSASPAQATQPAQRQTQPAAQQTQPAQQQTQPASSAGASSPAQKQTPANASPYKDGVYSGTGWSRHGSVSVTLTMKGGKMTSVVITGCTTHYPCGDVAPMPGEARAAQRLQVDIVSGATDSSMAFLGAVQQALAQASQG